MSTQDDAALVAELRKLHAECERKQMVHYLDIGKLHQSLPTLLRLAEEAIASRKVVEAAREFVETRRRIGTICGTCGAREARLRDALEEL